MMRDDDTSVTMLLLPQATGNDESGLLIDIGDTMGDDSGISQVSTPVADEKSDPTAVPFPLERPPGKKVHVAERIARKLKPGVANAKYKDKSKLDLPKRDLASFLGDLSDDRALSDLLLPGTHDALAYYGYPVSQCQSPQFPLESQLENGVRVFDIRLAVVNGGTLIAYHGIISQRVAFATVLKVIRRFLRQRPTECVVMSIKQEDFSKTPGKIFSTLLKDLVYAHREMWYLDDRIPSLGEVRGKIVLFSRFGDAGAGWPNGEAGMGIHPTTWPDSKKGSFDWYCAGTRVEMQDWYSIPSFLSIPEKFDISVAPLDQSTSSSTNPLNTFPFPHAQPPLAVSFTSAASFPLALPPMIALGFGLIGFRKFWWGRIMGWKGMNERMRDWVGDYLKSVGVGVASASTGGGGGVARIDEKSPNSGMEELGEEHEEKKDLRVESRKIRGWVLMDYIDEPSDLLPMLVECNYH